MRGLPLLSGTTISLLLSALLVGALPSSAEASPEPPATAQDDPGRMVLVLDSSGSMAERAAGGGTKIQAAKAALGQVVAELPEEAEVGIRVFGAKVFSRGEPGACTDTQNVVPVGPLDRDALTAAVADYEPYGETPIGNALEGAAKDLGAAAADEPRTIVLLSDGEPTCQPDPCKVAEGLTGQGIDLTVNVVGLDVSGKAREALRCIARAGGGDYYDASSTEDLTSSLVKVSVRPLRGFRLDGERVEGGTTSEGALALEPGTYVDSTLPDEGQRFYLVDKPAGGGISASALVRPAREDESWNTVVRVELMTPDGADCASEYDQAFQILGLNPIASIGAEYSQLSRGDEACAAAEQLLVAVSSKAGVSDFRLQLSAYPAIEEVEALPEPLESDTGDWVAPVRIPTGGERAPVVGGVSFDDAPELVPGTTYSDTLRPGEQLVYRVRAGFGQAVRFGARLGTDPQADERLGILGPLASVKSYSAVGTRLTAVSDPERGVDANGSYTGGEPVALTAAVPPVRARNIESHIGTVRATNHDGYQYFSLGLGNISDVEERQFAAPVSLRVELVGEVEGEPQYAGEVQGPAGEETTAPEEGDDEQATSATDRDDDERGGSALWWALGGVGALLLLGAAFVLGRRTRA